MLRIKQTKKQTNELACKAAISKNTNLELSSNNINLDLDIVSQTSND